MISDHLYTKLSDNLSHSPTMGQDEAIRKLSEFISDDFQDQIFLLRGYAGTGKTSLIASLVRTLKEFRKKTVLLAPTGRAAKVLAGFSGQTALTIHKKIYRQNRLKDGFAEFSLDKNLHKNTFFIIDEASMIANQSMELSIFGSGRLLDDLISYVYSGIGCKMVLVGDLAQLPPVGLDISEALDSNILESFGFEIKSSDMMDVVRQEKGSGILFNATKVREELAAGQLSYPNLVSSKFIDFKRISGQDLIESIQSSYDQVGQEECMIVCRSNKQGKQIQSGNP